VLTELESRPRSPILLEFYFSVFFMVYKSVPPQNDTGEEINALLLGWQGIWGGRGVVRERKKKRKKGKRKKEKKGKTRTPTFN